MKVEYKKDIRHNYMILSEENHDGIEPYCIKMLEHQDIAGVLVLEQRIMDNRYLFYYDITGKQSMCNLIDKAAITYDKLKQLIITIIKTLEKAYDYLLPEDDFILLPEYIYLDIISNSPSLCFFSGYNKNGREQLIRLIEYLMNKVDYNDKEAVLLVYQLYATSREEGFTFHQLKEILHGQNPLKDQIKQLKSTTSTFSDNESKEEQISKYNREISGNEIDAKLNKMSKLNKEDCESQKIKKQSLEHIPVMMERVEEEREVSCYSLRTYLYCAACVAGGMLIIIISLATRILYNPFGNRIEYSKLFALLLIVFCSAGYLLTKILDKKNKITKMVRVCEYIDPRVSTGMQAEPTIEQRDMQLHSLQDPNLHQRIIHATEEGPITTINSIAEEDENPTCLLNGEDDHAQKLLLKAIDKERYQDILLPDFPFFIGKLKKNVDYCLEQEVISRYHAKITKEGEQFYITDLNSTNGTYVNRKELQTYEKMEIQFGDEITFANIPYQFHRMN